MQVGVVIMIKAAMVFVLIACTCDCANSGQLHVGPPIVIAPALPLLPFPLCAMLLVHIQLRYRFIVG